MKFGISFDFWNTLFGNGNESQRYKWRVDYFHKIISTYINTDYNSIEKAFRASTKFFIHEWQNNFQTPTAARRIRLMADVLNVDISNSDVEKTADYFGKLIFSIQPETNQNNLEIVRQLSEKFPLGLISDTGYISGKYIRQFLAEKNMISPFTSLVFSDEQTYCKPHVSVFKLTCEKLKIPCTQLIHIGDLEKTDIKGIQNSGGISIKYTGWSTNTSDHTLADYVIHDYRKLSETIDDIVNR